MEQTKVNFALALRQLMDEKPLDKISVGEIAERAGYSRKAFYNHFLDKNDLLNWILYSQFVALEKDSLFSGGWGAFRSFLEFFAQDREFFVEALKDMGQNSLGQYFSDLLFEVVYHTTCHGFSNTLSSEKWPGLSVAVLVEDARLAIIVWLMDPDKPGPDALLDILQNATNAFCSMICFDRATRHGEPLCDHAINVLSENWSPEPDRDEMVLPLPTSTNARRREFAFTLDRCR